MKEESLLRNRAFLFLLLGGLCAMLGFSIFFLTVSWFIVDVLKEPAVLGIVLMSMAIPRVGMMLFGGVLADKVRKSLIMFVTSLMQVTVMLALLILFIKGWLNVTSLIVIAVLFGFLDAFFFPAVSALMPALVSGPLLQRANSLFQGSTELMFIIGPLVAGTLLSISNFAVTFSASALLILLSALFVAPPLINDQPPIPRQEKKGAFDDLKEGLAYVCRSHLHRTSTLIMILLNLFLLGPMLISFPILTEALGGTPFELSLLEGGLALGTFVASLSLAGYNLRRKRGRFVIGSLFLSFLLFILFSRAGSFPLLVLLSALTGLVAMLVYLPTITMVQERTAKDKLGRAMSIISLAASGFEPISFGLISFIVAAGITIQNVLTVAGGIGVLFALLLAWQSRRFLRLD